MSKYTPELAKTICLLIAEGYSLRQIQDLDGMPNKTTIMRWCIENDEFREQYTRAKENQADAFAEELVDIVDDSRNDWIERENRKTGEIYLDRNEELVSRAKLRVETRKWLMGKMKPKKYGDNSSVQLTGKDESPLMPEKTVLVVGEVVEGLIKKLDEKY